MLPGAHERMGSRSRSGLLIQAPQGARSPITGQRSLLFCHPSLAPSTPPLAQNKELMDKVKELAMVGRGSKVRKRGAVCGA